MILIYDQETCITLFRAITMLCHTNNILQNIPHIRSKCEEYFVGLALNCGIFPTFILIVRNIPHSIVNATKHYYGSE